MMKTSGVPFLMVFSLASRWPIDLVRSLSALGERQHGSRRHIFAYRYLMITTRATICIKYLFHSLSITYTLRSRRLQSISFKMQNLTVAADGTITMVTHHHNSEQLFFDLLKHESNCTLKWSRLYIFILK